MNETHGIETFCTSPRPAGSFFACHMSHIDVITLKKSNACNLWAGEFITDTQYFKLEYKNEGGRIKSKARDCLQWTCRHTDSNLELHRRTLIKYYHSARWLHLVFFPNISAKMLFVLKGSRLEIFVSRASFEFVAFDWFLPNNCFLKMY